MRSFAALVRGARSARADNANDGDGEPRAKRKKVAGEYSESTKRKMVKEPGVILGWSRPKSKENPGGGA